MVKWGELNDKQKLELIHFKGFFFFTRSGLMNSWNVSIKDISRNINTLQLISQNQTNRMRILRCTAPFAVVLRQTPIAQFLPPEIDFLGSLCLHVMPDKLCETSPCCSGLQTLRWILLCFWFFTQACAHLFIHLWLNSFKPWRRRARQHRWLSSSDNKGRQILRKDIARLTRQTWLFCFPAWLILLSLCPFVSSSLLFSFIASLPADFNGLEEARGRKRESEWRKEGWGGWGVKVGAPISRQGFNEEPLKFAVIEQRPCPLQKGPAPLWRHAVISSCSPSSISPSSFLSFLSLSIPHKIFTFSLSSCSFYHQPPLSPPVLLCDQDMDHVST